MMLVNVLKFLLTCLLEARKDFFWVMLILLQQHNKLENVASVDGG
jgi:hypothetical protein